jgi:GT2 family glycosyltransferase
MSPPACSRVATVVVTHHGPGPTLQACIGSLAAADPAARIVVVDNSGGTPVPVAEYGPVTGAGIEVVRVANEGYGAAANAGARRLGVLGPAPAGDEVPGSLALLNDDIVVEPGWLAPLVAALDADDGLGAVQPKLLLDRAAGGRATINSVGVTIDRFGAGSDIGYGTPDDAASTEVTETARPAAIPAFTGGAVLLRTAFLRGLGGFDERYFLYYEDVDLALRGAERGWRYACVPASTVRHAQGSSSAALGDEVVYLRERNRLWSSFRFHGGATIGRACWLGVRRLRRPPRGAHARALAAGLAGAPRRLVERTRARRRT